MSRKRANPPARRNQQPPANKSAQTQAQPQGNQAAQVTIQTATHTAGFTGPVPHPDIFAAYEQVLTGAAERILIMAEEDAAHQRAIEMAALNAKKDEVKTGQQFGLAIGLSALAITGLSVWMDQPYVAGVVGGTTVVGLVAVFVTGRWRRTPKQSLQE